MGFFKKLVKGVTNVVKGVTNAVSKVTGFAAKVLPTPLGGIAKTVSAVSGGVAGFASKLLDSSSANTPKNAAQAAQTAAFSGGGTGGATLQDISFGGSVQSGPGWWSRNLGWVIPTGLAFLALIGWLIFGKKSKR